jgi:hypothetical protein
LAAKKVTGRCFFGFISEFDGCFALNMPLAVVGLRFEQLWPVEMAARSGIYLARDAALLLPPWLLRSDDQRQGTMNDVLRHI